MTPHEKQLIDQLVAGNMPAAEFLKIFPSRVAENPAFVTENLAQASRDADGVLLEYTLAVGSAFQLFTSDHLPYLEMALQAKWHTSHENLALILKQFASPTSIEALYEAAKLVLPYLDYDDGFELARKCAWALGAIGSDAAKAKLILLSQSDNDVVAEHADHQLKRLNAL